MASSSSSSVALYIGALVVLALVNLMSESFVEGRSLHLDEGISMVTEALPQQQYFSLPAERFTEFLGNTPSVVSFAAFVTKYVFSAFLCQINVFYGLGRFSFFLSSFLFLFRRSLVFVRPGIRQKPPAILPLVCRMLEIRPAACRLLEADICTGNTAFFSLMAAVCLKPFMTILQ
jgi:hypothetical protein